jgi:non-ribosomal peptide synthetase component F
LEPLIGYFANQLVLRTDLSGDPRIRDLLARVRKTCLGAYDCQDIPFDRLVEELAPNRDLARNPLFQVMFVWQNIPRARQMEMSSLKVSSAGMEISTTRFDLTLTVVEAGAELRGSMSYNLALFEADTVRRMLFHIQRVLEQIADNPEKHLSQIDLVGEDERRLLKQWNQRQNVQLDEDEAATLLQQLEQMKDDDVQELLKKSVVGASSANS